MGECRPPLFQVFRFRFYICSFAVQKVMEEQEYTGFAEIRGLNHEWWRYDITLVAFYYDDEGRAVGNDSVVSPAPDPQQLPVERTGCFHAFKLKLREATRTDLRVYIIPRGLPREKQVAPDSVIDRVTVRINRQRVDLFEQTLPVNRWNGIELRYDIRGQQVRSDHLLS